MEPFLDFELPPSLIAQTPCEPRDQARLLVVRRADGKLSHRHFFHLPDLLRPGDLLVLNDTKVLPARLVGKRVSTGGKWHGLFLRTLEDGAWEIIGETRGKMRAGEVIRIEPGPLELELVAKLPGGCWHARPSDRRGPEVVLQECGHIPLPPYIRQGEADVSDRGRYQTIFAQHAGAAAAPTAGLHFTPALFERLQARDIAWTFVTLHVGLGTFRPLTSGDFTQHVMHEEWGRLGPEAVAAIEASRRSGGRVIAVGTTCVRVLETAAQTEPLGPWTGATKLFIYPPYRFRLVDALITNFHWPRTSLLLLVNALAGPDLTRQAYESAIAQQYRFFSYGDAMLIV